ncbi:MAG: 6-phosphogluconolactonase [Verrucomicrobia bacterium]|nr:6-phosphogluconolactonase [Verrucomicrobiota bacterium]
MKTIRKFDSLSALSKAAAAQFVEAAREAIAARGRFVVALSGGSTPRTLYERLAAPGVADCIDWPNVVLLWGDERCVNPDDPRSNYGLARDTLLDRVPVPASNVHRIEGERGPEAAAAGYERVLGEVFDLRPGSRELPCFDLVLLGLGKDGHTASLFVGGAALREQRRWVVDVTIAAVDPRVPRVTLTLPVLNAARRVWFVVAGHGKREVLRAVLRGAPVHSAPYPASLVKPRGELVWFVDETAAFHGIETMEQ